MDAAVEDKASDGKYDGEYTDEMKIFIEFVIDNKGGEEGKKALIDYWTNEFFKVAENKAKATAEAEWNALNMNEVIRYGLAHANVDETTFTLSLDFSGSDYTEEQIALANNTITIGMDELKKEWGAAFADNWADYQMTDIITRCLKDGIFHNTDNRTDKDIKAQGYLKQMTDAPEEANGRNIALMSYWDAEFASINFTPEEGDSRTSSEIRYDYFWDYYEMDDVKAGIFHGKLVNYTPTIEKYASKMEDNGVVNAERQGCVEVTEELAEILTALIDKEVFENVQGGWLKFCYYYEMLGA
jgi:hypothetical protein